MMRSMRRAVVWLGLSGALLAVLLTFVFPTRTFLAQRTAITDATEQLEVLRSQSGELEERAELLRSNAEIERLAREQYNLVRPGEEAYAILPAPGARETTAPVSESLPEAGSERNLFQKAWDALRSIF